MLVFVTEELFKRLDLPSSNIDIKVSGLNQTCANIKHKATVDIKSRINNLKTIILSCRFSNYKRTTKFQN